MTMPKPSSESAESFRHWRYKLPPGKRKEEGPVLHYGRSSRRSGREKRKVRRGGHFYGGKKCSVEHAGRQGVLPLWFCRMQSNGEAALRSPGSRERSVPGWNRINYIFNAGKYMLLRISWKNFADNCLLLSGFTRKKLGGSIKTICFEYLGRKRLQKVTADG